MIFRDTSLTTGISKLLVIFPSIKASKSLSRFCSSAPDLSFRALEALFGIIWTMEEGISIDEACARNVIGTQEDFERSCNPDGTVKIQPKTTTFTLKNDDTKSITIDNTHLYIAATFVLVLFVILAAFLIRKILKKKTS